MNLKKLIKLSIILLTLFVVITLTFSFSLFSKKEIKIGAIFSITGASFLGVPEAQTADMLVEKINKDGGINGYKIKLLIRDSGGSAEKAISLAKQLIEEEKVLAIIGPSTSGESMQIKGLCENAKTILISCAAQEEIINPVAKYVFKTPQKDSFAAMRIYDTMKDMKINKIAILSSNTSFGKGGKAQLEKYAKDYGMDILISEEYDKDATDFSAVLTKVKGKNVQAVVNWSIEDAQSIIPKNMKQLGMTMPLFQSHGFGNIKYVQVAGDAAEGIIFPCGRLFVADDLDNSNPQKAVLLKYKKDYEDRYKEQASTFGGHAYDAILVLTEAMKKAGSSTDKEKIRTSLENLKNIPGTGGIFNFSPEDHNGLDKSAFEMITVKKGKFVVFKK